MKVNTCLEPKYNLEIKFTSFIRAITIVENRINCL